MTQTLHPNPNRCCAHCGTAFQRRSHLGRPPLYCRPNCRKRAHDHRHGIHPPLQPRQPIPLTDTRHGFTLNDYDAGYTLGGPGTAGIDQKQHALRPAGFPDHNRLRPTLCGALARTAKHTFGATAPTACKTCRNITTKHRRPPPLGPAADLAQIEATTQRATAIHNRLHTPRKHPDNPHTINATLTQTLTELLTALQPNKPLKQHQQHAA